MECLFAKEVENLKGVTRCEVVKIEREISDYASEDMFNKIKDFLTEETDEKRHVFSDDAPTFGERVFVEVLYDEDEITDSEYASVETGLHAATGVIVDKYVVDEWGSKDFKYVLPNDIRDYLEEVVFPNGIDWCPALDICSPGEEGEGEDIESMFFTHGKDGEIIELDTVDDFIWYVDDWKERVMEALKTSEPNDAIFVEED